MVCIPFNDGFHDEDTDDDDDGEDDDVENDGDDDGDNDGDDAVSGVDVAVWLVLVSSFATLRQSFGMF